MRTVFVIGLFKSLQKPFESRCRNNNLYGKSVLADIGRKGTPNLLPAGQDAIHSLQAYIDKLGDYLDGYVVVLDYAELSEKLLGELDALSEFGCTVIYAKNGMDGWPCLERQQKPDTTFLNNLHERLWQDLPVQAQVKDLSVSEHFRSVIEKNKRILVSNSVFDSCDAVTPIRQAFLRAASDALEEVLSNGLSGRIDAFFRSRGLEHAQSGGVNATLTVMANGHQVHRAVSNTHLKKGDNTTADNAARLYYQLFKYNGCEYIAILYAGPHPDRDINGTCEIEVT